MILPLLRPHRWLLLWGLGLTAINFCAGLAQPYSLKYLVDIIVGQNRLKLLGPLALALFAACCIQALTAYLLNRLLARPGQEIIAQLRRRLQDHVCRLPLAFYDGTKTGVLTARIMNDVEGVRYVLGNTFIEFVGALLTSGVSLALLVWISPVMTAIVCVLVSLFIIAGRKQLLGMHPVYVRQRQISAEVIGRLNESLSGVRTIKGYHAQANEAAVFAAGIEKLLDRTVETISSKASMDSMAVFIVGLVGVVVSYLGTRQIVTGSLTVGGLLTYMMLLRLLSAPITQAVALGIQISDAMAGLQRAEEILREHREEDNPQRSVAIGPMRGHVVFDQVNFAYRQGVTVLHGINFEAHPGTMTALVGPSGSGKTTIMNLLAAFYDAGAGVIRVDGIDLSTVSLSSYRSQLGIVPQDTFLFAGTIRDNVAFSRPSATQGEIINACRMARVCDFAEPLPHGYDTCVGERGVMLSAGQKQRISIARAILADPRILILDEATSSLDSESEVLIHEALGSLMQGRTSFVIAHRLSTVRHADQILVIEDGRIVERGSHRELYDFRGRYWDLYTKQFESEKNLVWNRPAIFNGKLI
jgi:subfamily B ATP-binding cassette protein MsbA